jgi:hypothetical protein
MASSVVPLSEVAAETLRDFLGRMGMPREVVDWRYLDSGFNGGRNRGFAWIRRNRIDGMIGLIPFRVCGGGQEREVNWSCDWMLADPASNPGMGIILLRRAIESSFNLFGLGGTENTRRILPRIATKTIADAGVAMYLPLRSGAILRRLQKGGMLSRLSLPRLLYKIPLSWSSSHGRSPEIRTEMGLSPNIAPLLQGEPGENWRPCYDFLYLDWQIGRSPLLNCMTTYSPAAGELRAAAVYWRPVASTDFWRLAVWSRTSEPNHLDRVVRGAVAEIHRLGGMGMSIIVSRLDVKAQATLRSAGFLTLKRRRPLYVCANQSDAAIGELRGLSYLDTDLSYIGSRHEGWGY